MNDKEIAFIGKITAGITHEIKNVLASIKEISGLMEDILSMDNDESFKHREKFQKVLPKISEQVKRGVELTVQLNKFSHLADEEKSEVELNELTRHLIFLTSRFARLKNIAVQPEFNSQNLGIFTNPFKLQMAMYYCLNLFLTRLPNDSQIIIQLKDQNGSYHISISSKQKAVFEDTSSTEILLIKDITNSLGMILQYDFNVPVIEIQIPILTKNT